MSAAEVAVTALTADEAERLTTRITLRLGVIAENYEAVMPMIREAIERDAATALGYSGVSEYIAARFGDSLSRIGLDLRGEVVPELKAAGMSTRAIGDVLGVDHSTVVRDLRRSGGASAPPEEPVRVTGLDGKSYASTQPAREFIDRGTGEIQPEPRQRAYSPRTDVVLVINSALTRAQDAAHQAAQIKRDHLKDRSEEAATWGRSLSESMQSLQRLMDLLTEATR